jgi:uncharacterized membrane protein
MENPYSAPSASVEPPAHEVPEDVAKDIRNGWIAACISGTLTLIVTVIAMSGTEIQSFNAWSMLDVVFIFGLAFGIYKKSRAAATCMLIYFIVSKIILYIEAGKPTGIVLAIIFGYYYAKAMAATYKWHSIKKAART